MAINLSPSPVAAVTAVPTADVHISIPPPDAPTARMLYLYRSGTAYGDGGGEPMGPDDVTSRSLNLEVSQIQYGQPYGGEPLDPEDVLQRALYLYVSIGHDRDPSDVAARAVYTYETYTNGEIFPWIEKIRPTEQYRFGQVNIYGDGFGNTPAQEGSSVKLGTYDPTVPGPGVTMGIVTWTSRSPGLWPANLGEGTQPAITVTVPSDAESGMLSVEEST